MESFSRCGRAINAITPFHSQGSPTVEATVAYVAMRSPISDPFARFQNAERLKRAPMMQNHVNFFKPWDAIHESNPQEILERGEPISKVPFLIMQGALDHNVLPAIQQKFAACTKQQAAIARTSSSKAASTNGWRLLDRRQTGRELW